MARNPSYRAPAAADLHDERAAQPPGADAPLEAWGAKHLAIRDGVAVGCSLSGRAFIAMGEWFDRRASRRKPEVGCTNTSGLRLDARLEVRLVAVQPFMGELARCPHLANLRRLDLTCNRIGVDGAKALAGSPFLSGLQELVLSANDLGDAGLAALREASWFRNLTVLELAENGLRLEPDAQARVPSLPCLRVGLRDLDLSNNPLGPDLQLPTGLTRLALSRCGLGAADVANLAASGCFDSLEELDLSFNGLGPHPACGLKLLRLNLGFNDLEDDGVEALADSDPALEWLDLSANRITALGAASMADSHAFGSVRELNLTANPLGDAGVLALVRGDAFSSLRQLNVSNCGITDDGACDLAKSAALGGLLSLSLAWNAIGDAGVRALASCPDLAGLRELDLTGTHLGFAGAIALAESKHLVNLRSVVLGENHRLKADAVARLRERYNTA